MLFHEIYGNYYNAVAAILAEAVKGDLTEKRMNEIVIEKAFADARTLLTENRSLLDEISEFLLVKETITGDELMSFVNADKAVPPAPTETEEAPAEE
jgi:cell division protease FtsH